MRIITIQALTALALGVALAGTSPAVAQLSNIIPPHGSGHGDRDAQRGEFSIDDLDPEVTTAPLTGTLEVTFDVTIKSAIPSGTPLYCLAEFGATTRNSTASTSNVWEESNVEIATVSGSKATCTIKIPYSWLIPKASTTIKNQFLGVYAVGAVTGLTGKKGNPRALRTSSHEFLKTATLPANGAITKYTLDVTI
jgi:hypothetical protein